MPVQTIRLLLVVALWYSTAFGLLIGLPMQTLLLPLLYSLWWALD